MFAIYPGGNSQGGTPENRRPRYLPLPGPLSQEATRMVRSREMKRLAWFWHDCLFACATDTTRRPRAEAAVPRSAAELGRRSEARRPAAPAAKPLAARKTAARSTYPIASWRFATPTRAYARSARLKTQRMRRRLSARGRYLQRRRCQAGGPIDCTDGDDDPCLVAACDETDDSCSTATAANGTPRDDRHLLVNAICQTAFAKARRSTAR